MEFDFPVENFKTPPHPKGITLVGENVRLEPLNVQNHSANLHEANSLDVEGKNWDYLSYGCLLYTSPSPRDVVPSRMPSSA